MRNYLKAELFRNFHRMYLWGYIACVVGCGLLGCIAVKYINIKYGADFTVEHLLAFGINSIPAYAYLMMIFTDLAMGEEIKNNTIKNIVSSGLTRGKIYVCKIIESIVLMVFSTVVIFSVITLIGYIMLGSSGSTVFMNGLQDCISRGCIAMLLWSGAIAIGVVLLVVLRNGTTAMCVYVAMIMFVGHLLSLLGHYINPIFAEMKKYLITTQLHKVSEVPQLSMGVTSVAISVGILFTVIMTILGNEILKRKDI